MGKLLTLLFLLSFSTATFSNEGDDKRKGSRYQQRRQMQKKRIRKGFKSGELSEEEREELILGQKKVRQKKQGFKEDGELSEKERRKLKRAQSRQSKRIYRKKHN